ncbi:MAG TPA: GAF domain-containing sensor histidine kinase [Gaiellaceae bacterium]|nr:GAF domain-containing sensor histidine kinase [Gaiellaceae bacterium]
MPDRIRSLLDAGISLTSELSLDALLQRLTEMAAELTGAKYAALGVIDPNRTELESFVTTGLDPETAAAIGDLPRGRGILGVLIHEAQPLRLHDLGNDPRSVGFPPNHPEMRTFLGVPILLRGVAYGNLYLTEKEGGSDFTTEDQEIVTLLASQAAVAIENARLFESAKRWSDQLESLIEVGNALATEDELPRMLDLVARRLREILHARFVVVLLRSEGELRLEAAAGEVDMALGASASLSGTKAGRVLERGRSERVDSVIEDPESDLELTRALAMLTALYVPMQVRAEVMGIIVAGDKLVPDLRFTSEDLRLAETFASRAGIAADQARRVQRDAFRRVVHAQEEERRRLARELHDETGQALASILLGLKSLEEVGDVGELGERVATLRSRVVETLRDVRRLAVELRPAALDDFGLEPALERLVSGFADQTGLKVELESRLRDDRLPQEVETVLYRIVQEALTNIVKHADAGRVSIVVTQRAGSVGAIVEDDGRGFDAERETNGGIGLIGMRERVALLDGSLTIESAQGKGTTLVVEVPLR